MISVTRSINRGRRAARACAALGIAALAISGCGHSAPQGGAGGSGAFGAGQRSASPGGTGALGAGTTAAPSSAAHSGGSGSGPQIVYFKVTQQPLCAITGTSDAPYKRPEQPVKLAWKVTGASGVALSIDDPNFFKKYHSGSWQNYGPEGTVELPFACTDTAKRSTTHTYTINTLGDSSKGKTISVTAQNP
ncbi:MAG: hypothetical protein V7603_3864 [Micromonosporaceae bacterium]